MKADEKLDTGWRMKPQFAPLYFTMDCTPQDIELAGYSGRVEGTRPSIWILRDRASSAIISTFIQARPPSPKAIRKVISERMNGAT